LISVSIRPIHLHFRRLLTGTLHRFPKLHLTVVCLVATPLLSLFFARTHHGQSPVLERESLVTAPIVGDALERFAANGVDSFNAAVATPATAQSTDVETRNVNLAERVETVRAGDSLARVFERVAISRHDLAAVLDSSPLARALQRIHPGHELRFVTSPDKRLLKLTYAPDRLESLEFDRVDDGFVASQISRQAELTTAFRHTTIDQSLFVDSQRSGLNDEITLRLAQIFQWDIDFVLDIRKGDTFSMLYEEKYVDGDFVGYGKILAAEFVNQGTRYRAVYYTTADGQGGYYSPSGESMRKAFLRAPVEFSRISSNFNLRRFHPVQKRVMPHRGIDYVAPAGTPILAAGDGRVIKATRTEPNGNFVILQHGNDIQTKYLHLSKFGRGVARGARVRQGQVIGYVGATGWATAPHLHYEFLVDGTHKDPRTVPLPKAQPVPPRERQRFDTESASLLTQLDIRSSDVQLAGNP
jgi:murein DD-endopeptidase MepM/ murein hydrolase activator NlpD